MEKAKRKLLVGIIKKIGLGDFSGSISSKPANSVRPTRGRVYAKQVA